jgi:hypothetical protein
MWLIDTRSFSLREVHDAEIDYPYAILSHTWDEHDDDPLHREVTFQDMKDLDLAKNKLGWNKIKMTCQLARDHQPCLDWAWIDTCCIDKTNSAELTEAINSMFKWYREAAVCFVYLSDLSRSITSDPSSQRSRDDLYSRLPHCHWFRRGWTLQELIAPRIVDFYDSSWTKRGTKYSLKSVIHEITSIDLAVLADSDELHSIPVGRRLSWASNRSTKRVEDIAYSLFGIFNVHLPLIYGEGHKAFLRLQAAIAQQTNDLSMFAWTSLPDEGDDNIKRQKYYGMFAQSHRYFRDCKHLISLQDPFIAERHSFVVTGHSLEFDAITATDKDGDGHLMNLFCQNTNVELSNGQAGVLALRLVKTVHGFARQRPEKLMIAADIHETHIWPGKSATIKVPGFITAMESARLEKRAQHAFRVRVQCPEGITAVPYASLGYRDEFPRAWETMPGVAPKTNSLWDHDHRTMLSGGFPGFTGLFYLSIEGKSKMWPKHLRFMCGFAKRNARESTTRDENPADLQAWAGIIPPKDECIKVDEYDQHADVFAELEKILQQDEPYASVVASLNHQISKAKLAGFTLPRSAVITPYQIKLPWHACLEDLRDTLKPNPVDLIAAVNTMFRVLMNVVQQGRNLEFRLHGDLKPDWERHQFPTDALKLTLSVNDIQDGDTLLHEILIVLEAVRDGITSV